MKVDVVQQQRLTPESLWRDCISQRRPVLIDGHLTDPSWAASEKWTVDYLKATAGGCGVMVEERRSNGDSFGKGQKRPMLFGEFLEELTSGNEHLYLSAQDAEIVDGFPSLLSPPLTALKADVCLRPSLMGHLIPQQLNIWMGCSQNGTADDMGKQSFLIGACSGLHHDYHDNLYVLLKGSKHFSLFPPSKAVDMYTQGRIQKIHENGRIVYYGQGEVNADGSDPVDVAHWQKQENRQQQKSDDSTSESELEDILDRCLEERDDYVPSDSASRADPSDASEDANEDMVAHRTKRHKGNPLDTFEDDRPSNFSRVDLTVPWEKQKEAFPNFPGLPEAIECQITEGQMLYLPAGWFHNVTSLGLEGASGIHLALNYWCYPPDNLPTNNESNADEAFHRPYLSGYWSSLWASKIVAKSEPQSKTQSDDRRAQGSNSTQL